MEETLNKKAKMELGFDRKEAKGIVEKLDILLCTYQVFFHKLQNYHWNVVGGEFFDLHDVTQEMYEKGLVNIDEIAERIRVFGSVPQYKMQEYVNKSCIEETTHELSSDEMTLNLIDDFVCLISCMVEASEFSHKNGDLGSVFMMNKMIKEFETNHWKLSSWINKKYDTNNK